MTVETQNDDLGLGEEEKNDLGEQSDVKIYDAQYVERLKKEALKWKSRAKENKDAAAKAVEIEARIKENETSATQALLKAQEMNAAAERRMINAELKTLAGEFGLKDMAYVKIADLSKVKLDENGDVVGAREMMTELKKHHPDLFKMVTSTNIHFATLHEESGDIRKEKPVKSLSREDYAKKEREFLAGAK